MARRGGPDPLTLVLVLGGAYVAFKPGADGQSFFQKAVGQVPVLGGATGAAGAVGNTLSAIGQGIGRLFTPGGPPAQGGPSSDGALQGSTIQVGANYFQWNGDARVDPGGQCCGSVLTGGVSIGPLNLSPSGASLSGPLTLYPAFNHQGSGGNFVYGLEWWSTQNGFLFPRKDRFVKLDELPYSVGPDTSWVGYSGLPAVTSVAPGPGIWWINAYIRDGAGYHFADWNLGMPLIGG